ncbi:MAG: tail fiber protein, partial [Sarcina sp.]
MADIKTYVDNIRKAIYGKDVRQSLATGIEKINEEVEENTSVVQATDKDIKSYKEATSIEIKTFKDSTNKDLKDYKENTLKNINDYKDNTTNEIKIYHEQLENAEKARVNNENYRKQNELIREDLKNDLVTLQDNYNKALHSTSSVEVVEARQGKDTLKDNIEDIKNNVDDIKSACSTFNNRYAPLNEFNNIKDQMAKNKPIIISDDTPIGTITWYTAAGVGLGSGEWQICDGRELNKNDFKELYEILGGKYGETSTTFKVPDLLHEELFIRSCNSSGTNIGEMEQDETKHHWHECMWQGEKQVPEGIIGRLPSFGTKGKRWTPGGYHPYAAFVSNNDADVYGNTIGGTGPSDSGNYGLWIVTKETGGAETRPKNIKMLPIIKAKSRAKDMISITQEIEQSKEGYSTLKEKFDSKANKQSFKNISIPKKGTWYRIGSISGDSIGGASINIQCSYSPSYYTSVNINAYICNGYAPQLILNGVSHTNGGTITSIRLLSKGWNESYLEVYTVQANCTITTKLVEGEGFAINAPVETTELTGYKETTLNIQRNLMESDVNGVTGWRICSGILEQWGYVEIPDPSKWTKINLPVSYPNNNYN